MNDKKMTRKDFDQRVKDLTKLIQEKAIVFPNDTADAQIARIKRAKTDLIFFAQTYYPHYITAEFADFHVEELTRLKTALDTSDSSIVSEIMSRGFGKTVLLAVIFPIWAALTKKSMFTIFGGADRELSKERTVSIKLELVHNARLKWDFPELAMDPMSGEETDFETPTGARMIALGYKQVIRGRVHGAHRPRLIIIDDLENHNDTNPKIAERKYQYVTEEAFGAFGPGGGLIIWLGNLTNSQSALQKFVTKCDEDPGPYTRYRIVKAEDENGHSNWPQAYPDHVLRAKRQVMGRAGYDRHYMMKPGIDGDVFKEEWIRFWNPFAGSGAGLQGCRYAGEGATASAGMLTGHPQAGFDFRFPTLEELNNSPTVTYCDPSLGNGETNDYKAIMTVSFCGGIYYLRDVHVKRETIIEMLDYMYQVDKHYKTRHYMEDNFWQKLIWQYLPQVAANQGYMLGIQGVQNRLSKTERVLSLQPLYEWGHVIHCGTGQDWNTYKEQLIGFPNASNDDGPDALAGAIERFKYLATANQYHTIERGSGGYANLF